MSATVIGSYALPNLQIRDFPSRYSHDARYNLRNIDGSYRHPTFLGCGSSTLNFTEWTNGNPRDALYLLDLEGVTLVSRKKGVDKRHQIILNNGNFLRDITDQATVDSLIASDPYRIDGNRISIGNISLSFESESIFLISSPQSNQNYYHWFAFYLQSMIFLDQIKARTDCLVLTDRLSPFQRLTLEATGLNLSKLIEYQGGSIKIRNLVCPSTCFSIQRIKPEFLPIADKVVKNIIGNHRYETPRRLYLERGKTKQRRILNEDKVVSLLSKKGFKSIDPGSMSFPEQILYFSNAEHVVSPHGAALTNLIFSKKLKSAFECFSPTWMHGCYRDLSLMMGVDYFYSIGKAVALPDSPERESDYLIDLTSVDQYLGEI